ncbi:MAG: LEA type 2 family protein [Chitinophagaceae bacterium]|nr:LEA type 2 family protein [Chitinophagaceae bacterium]
MMFPVTRASLAILVFAFSLFTSSCSSFETPEIREPEEMQVRILKFNGPVGTIRIESHCHNQNGIGFTFKGGELDLFLNDHPLGHAVVDTTFKVASHADFMVPIQFELDLNKFSATNLDLSKKLRVKVAGNMKGSAFGIGKTLPILYEKEHLLNLVLPYAVDGN